MNGIRWEIQKGTSQADRHKSDGSDDEQLELWCALRSFQSQ